jgi:hypothetical protein
MLIGKTTGENNKLDNTDNSSDRIFSVKRYYDYATKVGADIFTIGTSEKNQPILALRKGSGKRKVLFVSRIHGNEPATTEAMLEFFEENSFIDLQLYGIFLANPDGAVLYENLWLKNQEADWKNNFNDARLNANKIDINRDWLDLSQKETRAIQKFIISLNPDFAVDFHEYYWSDMGYPPKYPTEDKDGFMATMTDAPFFGAVKYVKDISEEIMNYLIENMENEFNWKIKKRHFIGNSHDTYENLTFLGIYLALRGFPKLLVETWGVACSTLFLEKRIAFHKRAMQLIISWIGKNESRFSKKPLSKQKTKYNLEDIESNLISTFTNILNLHGIKYKMYENSKITIYCNLMEAGFIKAIYHLIFERRENNI